MKTIETNAKSKGFLTSEFWAVILTLLHSQGVFKWLTPEKIQSTADRVQEVANQLQRVSTEDLIIYGLVGAYVYYRNQVKLKIIENQNA